MRDRARASERRMTFEDKLLALACLISAACLIVLVYVI
jgi:hypothetical protein